MDQESQLLKRLAFEAVVMARSLTKKEGMALGLAQDTEAVVALLPSS